MTWFGPVLNSVDTLTEGILKVDPACGEIYVEGTIVSGVDLATILLTVTSFVGRDSDFTVGGGVFLAISI